MGHASAVSDVAINKNIPRSVAFEECSFQSFRTDLRRP